MRRWAILVVALAAAAGGLVMGASYGADDGLLTFWLLAAYGAAVLALSHVLARRRRRLGSLARQFQAGIAVVVGVGLLGVALIALRMFVSSHDALLVAVVLGFAGVVAAYAASLLATAVLRDVDAIATTLTSIGDGRRDLRCSTAGADELAQLAASANAMSEQLVERERSRDEAWAAHRNLIAAVSHDLRTPLTSLQVLSEAISDDVLDEPGRRGYANQMGTHIRALSALVDDLFELSRLQAGDVRWSMQQVLLDELVEETVEAMRPQASASGVAVGTQIPPGTAPAQANPEKLQRVLFNLMQNAIRHTPPDGSVTVAAESNASSVEVEVADDGEGVAPGDREHVFDPFYRGGSEAARTRQGSGLGLTICQAIVEAHGGRIWLADSERGTRIRFSLPIARDPAVGAVPEPTPG